MSDISLYYFKRKIKQKPSFECTFLFQSISGCKTNVFFHFSRYRAVKAMNAPPPPKKEREKTLKKKKDPKKK